MASEILFAKWQIGSERCLFRQVFDGREDVFVSRAWIMVLSRLVIPAGISCWFRVRCRMVDSVSRRFRFVFIGLVFRVC